VVLVLGRARKLHHLFGDTRCQGADLLRLRFDPRHTAATSFAFNADISKPLRQNPRLRLNGHIG
jgi:hypothetical protein